MELPAATVTATDDTNVQEILASLGIDTTATCDISEPPEPQCYCNQTRNYAEPELQCGTCFKWFHLKCIKYNVGAFHAFITSYHFTCQRCSGEGEEKFARKNANFHMMCQTALANLMVKNNGLIYFSKDKDILPYLEQHWDQLASMPRKANNSWHSTIHKILTTSELFKAGEVGSDVIVGLANTDVSKMGPSYERFLALAIQYRGSGATSNNPVPPKRRKQTPLQAQQNNMQSGSLHTSQSANLTVAGAELGGRDNKIARRGNSANNLCSLDDPISLHSTNHPGGNTQSSSSNSLTSSRYPLGIAGTAAATGRLRLNACGFPMDFPFNKDGYRYILVEPDPHAPGRTVWEEHDATAGKPIPGFFYRVYLHQGVLLSCNDRAAQLKLHSSQMSVCGDKGYCMVRATHGVTRGRWYFEVRVQDQPDGSHARIGWAQSLANLHTPCGFDKFGYSWRSRKGTIFHDSCGKHYANEGFGKDDVIGCFVELPDPLMDWMTNVREEHPVQMEKLLPSSFKDRALIKFKNHFYFEEKDDLPAAEKALTPLKGAKIIFYRNGENLGVAFRDIYSGCYFPAISLYKAMNVSVNFGPDFEYPPTDQKDWRPMCERVDEMEVDQTMSDLLSLVDKEEVVLKLLKR